MNVRAWSIVPSTQYDENTILELEFHGRHGSNLPNAVSQFCNVLSVDAVSWLHCGLQPVAEWNRQQLVDFFTCFPVLEALKISSSTGKRVAMVLASPIPGRKLSANIALLQHLCKLTLKDFDFGPPHTKSRTAKPGKCEYIPLLEALRKCKAALGRIPKLVMTSCHITEEWAEEMRQEIELEWVPL